MFLHRAVDYVARQIDVDPAEWAHYDWDGRTIKYHRAQIRTFLGFREATVEDGKALAAWLVDHVLPQDQHPDHLHNQILERCRALHIEPPTPERIDRLVRSALHAFETSFCAATYKRLSPLICERLEALLLPESTAASGPREPLEPGWAVLTRLLADPGPANLESLLEEIAKLDQVRRSACHRISSMPSPPKSFRLTDVASPRKQPTNCGGTRLRSG